jgi:hypothetical protein
MDLYLPSGRSECASSSVYCCSQLNHGSRNAACCMTCSQKARLLEGCGSHSPPHAPPCSAAPLPPPPPRSPPCRLGLGGEKVSQSTTQASAPSLVLHRRAATVSLATSALPGRRSAGSKPLLPAR